TEAEAYKLAREGLSRVRARHKRWFSGKNKKYVQLDEVFLTLEGLGNWTAYAWLVHPKGGRMTKETALKGFRRDGKQWSQDEGLALFLVIDRLMPGWQSLAFADKPKEVFSLLEQALGHARGSLNSGE
ncbi:MAG: hypothetical protein AB7P49_12075, partial [Bdellovibrionales bacterium]